MKKANFSPIGSPIAVSPIGTPLVNGAVASNQGFYPSSPVGTSLRSPRGMGKPSNRLSSDFNGGWDSSERPSWGSMGNLPSFVSLEIDESGTNNGMNIGMNPASSARYPPETPNSTPTFGMIPTSLPMSSNVAPRSVAPPIAPPSNVIASPLSPNRPSHLVTNGVPFSEYDMYTRTSSLSNGLNTTPQTNSPLTPQPINGLMGGNPKNLMNGGNTSPAAPLMKPAPLQRAGSAGGVLMHAPRRPPPPSSGVTSITTSADSWSVPTPSNAHSTHFKQPMPYEQEQSANEDWFDQFGGMEMEGSSASFGYDSVAAAPASEVHNTPQSYDNNARSSMNNRYMPNQRGNFASPRVALYTAQEPMAPHSATPSYLSHSMQMGMSPQNASPISVGPNSPLTNPSFSPIKHSSRILMLHNFDQLNLDVNALRTLFSAQGVLRSVSPFPDSNTILISYFDLRHAQKAMANLSGKTLSNGALIELQYHFLRDFQAKDANQGTLVIFNLDPAITNTELAELFGKYGELKEIRESPNRKHKFVEFYDVRCAEKAIKALNKSDLHGRKIKIEPSRPGGTSKPENSFQKFDSSYTTMGRRGSLGSAMHNVNPIFTHSAPSLPSMTSATYIGSAPGPSQNFVSFSPSAAPLLPTSPAYLPHAAQPRFDYPPTDDAAFFTEAQFHMTPNGILASHHLINQRGPLNVDGTMMPNPAMVGVDRIDDTFERSVLESALLPLPTPFGNDGRSAFSENSTTASLFGMESYNDVISETGPDPLQGLLLSPTSTPRSSVASGSSSSSDLGVIDSLKADEDFSQFIAMPMHSHAAQASQRTALNNMVVGVGGLSLNGGVSQIPGPGGSGVSNMMVGANGGNATGLNLSGGSNETAVMSGGGASQMRFDIIIPHVLGGLDTRTTLMIKNIPNKYDQEMLLLAVNKRHQGTYDFFYLPIDFKNRCNVGYAFINFIDPKSIPSFYEEFDNKKWEKFNSEKVCRISYARIQGKQSMIEHFKNSSLMFEDPKCRPLIFHSDGSAVGKPEPFPIGPNVRPRSRKDSTGSSSNGSNGVVAGSAANAGMAVVASVASSIASSIPLSSPSPIASPQHGGSNSSPTIAPLHSLGQIVAGSQAVSGIGSSNGSLSPSASSSPAPNSPTRPYKQTKRDKTASSPRSVHD